MQRLPLVTIVMIFRDAETFMREGVESVLRQTYPHWELIFVDDGSIDGSTEIALAYAGRDAQRIRYVQHPNHANRGMSASRNAGIAAARGEYLAFLDADDVFLEAKLARQVSILERETRAAMVYGRTQHWYSWTGKVDDAGRDRLRTLGVEPDRVVLPPALPILYVNRQAQTPGMCGILVRTKTAKDVGGFEESFAGMFEDWVFICKICLACPVYVESGSWDRYRQHENSAAERVRRAGRDFKLGPTPEFHDFLRWLDVYVNEIGVRDAALREALDRQLWPFNHPHLYRLKAEARRSAQRARRLANRAWARRHLVTSSK
jgi:glycosyltransferase involved in cell wall biosynthesis